MHITRLEGSVGSLVKDCGVQIHRGVVRGSLGMRWMERMLPEGWGDNQDFFESTGHSQSSVAIDSPN